ncbi:MULTISPECIES: acyl-CoA dehydrogenase family protein [Streptomyces]|uniref:Acyl-CoA dehydrogenase FadE n=2 Tax=Streptomyces TaxID=1883 RepID=A0ABQ3NW01_STRVG|nr:MULTISPECIES: acyl-CoA dehydrogenase family protein [Streptomyces]GLV90185.1 putative acyl-CoA dehydrogenase FadE [Streptomyces lavendulae subsp. lavendulae]MBP2344763.1 alkylation response protein AidB-like acyl-CoA dehydrogenase [Streptomyces virginiae]MCI4082151.1 acyl-CoA dehydrogenase family protein [Streptomyces sp. MMS21 TC-5]RSS86275.1 acyl-CoA dehydrogenase [Streptomyces sp. WAC05950]GGP88947.1 putative acyl-CoA dehydrogenase FadE [Streptomyces virginiae]
MDFSFGAEEEELRVRARAWLTEHLVGPYAQAVGLGGPGSEHEGVEARRAWERELGRGGWIGQGWDAPEGAYGQRRLSLTGQVVWAEEYAALRAPGRVGHIGENLLAPTLIAYGSQEQQRRFLPAVARGEELWCQGYSEPGAGSDLAGIRTAAVRDPADGLFRVTGQKIWTSLARDADWCFVLARTEPGSRRHRGLSFLLVRMDQPGRVEVRPIRQMSGTSEFNEVFFDGAVAAEVVGGEGDGWTVAMGLLALERGVSTLVQQIGFAAELERVLGLYAASTTASGAPADPAVRDRLVRQWAELRTMRWNALRTLGAQGDPGAPSVAKLLWGGWHRRLGELAVEVRGAAAAAGPAAWAPDLPYELGLDEEQRLFLFTRADTIYGGSDEIQRNIIAERVLGLPKESR